MTHEYTAVRSGRSEPCTIESRPMEMNPPRTRPLLKRGRVRDGSRGGPPGFLASLQLSFLSDCSCASACTFRNP